MWRPAGDDCGLGWLYILRHKHGRSLETYGLLGSPLCMPKFVEQTTSLAPAWF
jgi:hypothetical protein